MDINKRRVILFSPFVLNSKPTVSHGLVVYCEKTNRVVVVKRKYTPTFVNILLSIYRPSQLPFYLKEITKKEKDILLNIVNDIEDKDKYINYIEKILYKFHDNIVDYRYNRMKKDSNLISRVLNNIKNSPEDTEWMFPKGRMDYSLDASSCDCAIREFKEEVGIKNIPEAISIRELPRESFLSFNGRKIDTVLWEYLVEDEFELPKIKENYEVVDVRWINIDETNIRYDK